MTDWTNTINPNEVQFSMNLVKTHVTIKTLHGSYTEKVSVIQEKLRDSMLLPEVRRMFEEMWKYYEKNK